jgi:tetratricopeptide (TPR) repeat protein
MADPKSCHSIKNLLQTDPTAAPDGVTNLEFSYTNINILPTGPTITTASEPSHSISQPADKAPSLSPFSNVEEFLGGDLPNFNMQPELPRNRMEPLDITEASAKEAESLAAVYWHAEDFASAEPAYLDAISQYSYLLGYDDLRVCQLRSNLADTQAHLHRLDKSISTRRQIIAACWLKYGENADETLHYTEKLAGVLALQKQDEEAHFLYRKAADGYQKTHRPALRLRCLTQIVRLFLKSGSNEAALPILHSAFVGYLSLPSESYGIGTETHNSVVSLRDLYLRLGPGSRWNEIVSKLSHMQRLMETEPMSNSNPVPNVICEAINLAYIFSRLREFETVEPLFQLGLARFEVAPKSTILDFVKATVQHRYANHLSRKEDIIGCAEYLLAAFQNLTSVGPKGDELAAKVLRELAAIMMKLEYYPSSETHGIICRIRDETGLMSIDNPGLTAGDDEDGARTISTESFDTNQNGGLRTLAGTNYEDGDRDRDGSGYSTFEISGFYFSQYMVPHSVPF